MPKNTTTRCNHQSSGVSLTQLTLDKALAGAAPTHFQMVTADNRLTVMIPVNFWDNPNLGRLHFSDGSYLDVTQPEQPKPELEEQPAKDSSNYDEPQVVDSGLATMLAETRKSAENMLGRFLTNLERRKIEQWFHTHKSAPLIGVSHDSPGLGNVLILRHHNKSQTEATE